MNSGPKSRKAGRDSSTSSQDWLPEPLVHVWLAGLGAISKAQTEGNKLLDELIKEGARVQAQQHGADKKEAARSTLDDLHAHVQRFVNELPPYRVLEELHALRKQVDALNANVEKLMLENRALHEMPAAQKRSRRP